MTWWGTLSFMLIEGTGFALVLAIYFYLASLAAGNVAGELDDVLILEPADPRLVSCNELDSRRNVVAGERYGPAELAQTVVVGDEGPV